MRNRLIWFTLYIRFPKFLDDFTLKKAVVAMRKTILSKITVVAVSFFS
jgi:hypothetical protein